MIVFDIACASGHRFEAWFRSGADYDAQREAGHVACPECGTTDVRKAPMAPHIARSVELPAQERASQGGNAPAPAQPSATMGEEVGYDDLVPHSMNAPALPAALEAELKAVFRKVRKHVESTCDYVGDRFAEEARRIHYGESEERPIYGEASHEEAADLLDEGIEFLPLPGDTKTDA